jgi:hypothetical protein
MLGAHGGLACLLVTELDPKNRAHLAVLLADYLADVHWAGVRLQLFDLVGDYPLEGQHCRGVWPTVWPIYWRMFWPILVCQTNQR